MTVHYQGDTALHYAVVNEQKGNVEKLLKHGMRVQHQSSADGGMPLHRAAQVGHIEIATVLLNHGADKNAQNYVGQTPLHVALEHNQEKFAKFMFDKGARKKCKPNCMRCQMFNDAQNSNKGNQNKKRRRHQKREAVASNPMEVGAQELEDHLVLERQNEQASKQASLHEPQLICKDFKYLNLDNILRPGSSNHSGKRSNSLDAETDDDLSELDLSDEIRKEKKALGGPMFSKEENEKLRREKLRGGDYKEKSSEDSQENSDGGSPPPQFPRDDDTEAKEHSREEDKRVIQANTQPKSRKRGKKAKLKFNIG